MLRLFLFFLTCGFFYAGCTASNPEYPDMSACTLGERRCDTKDRAVALVCGRDANDKQTLLEEGCPTQALCESGRCVPPAGAKACQNATDCDGTEVCTPLVLPGTATLGLFCMPGQPGTPASSPCGKDADCTSYKCLQQAQGRYCFKACSNDGVCGTGRRCLSLSITVTGVQGQISTCSSP
ncbi:MAG TPA: hypothetical protein PKE31_03165 [Pseudomonadota bacterium]|nr:hypothetical protein [Pseudomonadota bacterium]